MNDMKVISNNCQFNDFIKNHDYLLILFYAQWLSQNIELNLFLNKLKERYTKFVFARVDIELNKDTALLCSVEIIPTFKIYLKGMQVEEIIGFKCDLIQNSLINQSKNF